MDIIGSHQSVLRRVENSEKLIVIKTKSSLNLQREAMIADLKKETLPTTYLCYQSQQSTKQPHLRKQKPDTGMGGDIRCRQYYNHNHPRGNEGRKRDIRSNRYLQRKEASLPPSRLQSVVHANSQCLCSQEFLALLYVSCREDIKSKQEGEKTV